jgi:ABC-2 type transport system permease protein
MRNIYLIFRRDYLGYVKAWGFWLSLAAVPALMLVGSLFALFAAQSSPIPLLHGYRTRKGLCRGHRCRI